ncbi:Kelch-type beta propeller, partial [Globisporangium splendens]
MVVCCGICGGAGYDGSNRVNDFYEFNFNRRMWSIVTASGLPPNPRDRHVAVVYKDSFYVFAGFDGSSRVNDFIEYNFCTWTLTSFFMHLLPWPSGSLLYPKTALAFADLWSLVPECNSDAKMEQRDGCCWHAADSTPQPRGRRVCVAFGTHSSCFLTETGTWTLVAATGRVPRPSNLHTWHPRYRSSLVVHKNTCVLFGGHDGSRHLNDVHVFNFGLRSWTSLVTEGPAPIPRDSHVAVTHSNSMYIFGGSTGSAMNDFYELNLESNMWQPLTFNGQSPGQRFCHVGSVYDSSLIIFGGYDGSSRLNDFKQFRFDDEEFELDIPESTLISDLRALVNSEVMSDITFVAMLTSDMLESRAREVEITDVRRPIFLSFLEYLYSDYLDVSVDVAMELFVAADRYGVDRLKRICESRMLGSLCIENAATILHAADLHNAAVLRDQCIAFMLNNFDAVTKTNAFEEMGRTNVDLVFELLKRR